ncbi:MAG: hypothetical protein V4488_00570 [Pseudomonadota bacterium]
MKQPTLLLTLWLALLAPVTAASLADAPAAKAHNPATYGVHGMAVFGGEDGLYASHLPMFHAPHDYQLVLKFHLADPALNARLKKQLDGNSRLWTLAPEKFEIDRLAPGAQHPLRSFKGDLVMGHFEQGGKTRYANARIAVDKVLIFRQLSPERKANDQARYWQIGSGGHRFLLKNIDSRPDFDHIVPFSVDPNAPTGLISIEKKQLQEPAAATLKAALERELKTAAQVRPAVYFYTDDLN